MSSLIYTHQTSKLSKKQRAAREELLKQQRKVQQSLRADTRRSTLIAQPAPYRRETPNYPSLNSGIGNATLAPKKEYTGDKILGLATMHKSNCVPVFSESEAKEISSMR